MSFASIKLVDRCVASYEEYFKKVHGDRLLAMIVNPWLATQGFNDLILVQEDDGRQLFEHAKGLC